MHQLYDFKKNIVLFRSAATFEIVKLILLYDLIETIVFLRV